jgi:hypothetical protein
LALIQSALPQFGLRKNIWNRRHAAMPATDPTRQEAAASGPTIGMAIAAGLLTATLGLSALMLPPAFTLPTVCLTALAAAGATAAFAWNSRVRHQGHPNYWDIAGALTFVGMCAAMLSEPDQLWPLLEAMPRRD